MTEKQTTRNSRALGRLEAQLKSGVKTVKKSTTETTELTASDIKRIEKEISVLKTRM